jgi:hypothetical protein
MRKNQKHNKTIGILNAINGMCLSHCKPAERDVTMWSLEGVLQGLDRLNTLEPW